MPQAATMGIVVPFSGSLSPKADTPATRGRKPHDATKPKAMHYVASADRLDIVTASALDGELTPAARRVLAIIVAHYNHHKGFAFPGEDRVAGLLGLARPVVSAAVKLLVARGWLKVERTRNGNRNGGNRYYLVLDKAGPVLDAAGLNVTKSGRSGALSVTSCEPESHVSDRLNVTFSCASASSKHDHNPATEPNKITQQSEHGRARARELPCSLSREDDRHSSQAVKGPLPADYQFPVEAVAAVRKAPRNLSESDIARALAGFRKRAGDGLDTAAGWAKRGAAYLATVESKPDPNEMGRVPGGALQSDRRCKRSEVKPWESWIDSKGVRHPARVKTPRPVV